jgi:hypothetical protein
VRFLQILSEFEDPRGGLLRAFLRSPHRPSTAKDNEGKAESKLCEESPADQARRVGKDRPHG